VPHGPTDDGLDRTPGRRNGGSGGGRSGPAVELHGGPPAWALAAAVPLVAIGLIWFRTSQSGLSSGPDDPVPPVLVAGLTVLAAVALAWRSLTQSAVLDRHGLHCRNLSVSFHVEWDRVERLDVVHRAGLQFVEVRVQGLRRRHRLGAATRFHGEEAEAVLDALRADPHAAVLLRDAST